MNNSGHRLGASGTRLENTIEGLRNAIDNTKDSKFRYWEFDIRESIDGIVFVFHDDSIEINGELATLAEMTFSDIKEAGDSLEIEIPTFSEVVTELEGRSEDVMVEIKEILSFLNKMNINRLLIEGGSTLSGSFVEKKLVNLIYWFSSKKNASEDKLLNKSDKKLNKIRYSHKFLLKDCINLRDNKLEIFSSKKH